MRFTYIYRDASGAKQAGEIEAEDRADCFAKLKERGIVPVNVREGDEVSAQTCIGTALAGKQALLEVRRAGRPINPAPFLRPRGEGNP